MVHHPVADEPKPEQKKYLPALLSTLPRRGRRVRVVDVKQIYIEAPSLPVALEQPAQVAVEVLSPEIQLAKTKRSLRDMARAYMTRATRTALDFLAVAKEKITTLVAKIFKK